MTTLINVKDAPKGWRTDPHFVYIGRPSYLGNPFHIGAHGSRRQVIEKYRAYIQTLRAENPEEFNAYLESIRGAILVCFCKPLACHGDVILELLNEGKGEL